MNRGKNDSRQKTLLPKLKPHNRPLLRFRVCHPLSREAALLDDAAKGVFASAGVAGVYEDVLSLLTVALGHDLSAASGAKVNRRALQLCGTGALESLLRDRGGGVLAFWARHDDHVSLFDGLKILHGL